MRRVRLLTPWRSGLLFFFRFCGGKGCTLASLRKANRAIGQSQYESVARRICEGLQCAELKQTRVLVHGSGGVGKIAKGGSFSASPLECGLSLFLGLHHLREYSLHFTRKHDVLHVG